MKSLTRYGFVVVAIASAVPAAAELREYCPTRPGLNTPACIVDRGHVSIETAVADWTRNENSSQREDTVLIGDTLVRLGLTDTVEAQLAFTPFGHDRTRDKLARTVDAANAVGDVTLAFKANLHNPDGKGFSIAVQPYVTLPVGRMPIGAGDWTSGLLVPISYDLTDALTLQATPEMDAAADKDGRGRHFAASATGGLGYAFTKSVNGNLEFQALRDDDPAGKTTQLFGSVSVAWMPKDDLQFDIGTVIGLNHDAADAELYAGISRRF